MPQGDGTGPAGWGCGRRGRESGGRCGAGGGRRGAGASGSCARRGRGDRSPATELPPPPLPPGPTSEQELDHLRAEARVMEEQIRSLRAGTGESAGGRRRLTATVDADKCLLCGACEDVCPSGAIAVTDRVVIAGDKCSGCGACVQVCPNEAIRLV